jgi:hypothetical protein
VLTNCKLKELKISHSCGGGKGPTSSSGPKVPSRTASPHSPSQSRDEHDWTGGGSGRGGSLMFVRPTPSPSPSARNKNSQRWQCCGGPENGRNSLSSSSSSSCCGSEPESHPHHHHRGDPQPPPPSQLLMSPRPAYPGGSYMFSPPSYNIYNKQQQQLNGPFYRSSSVASVFGGKPLISPPKLTIPNHYQYQFHSTTMTASASARFGHHQQPNFGYGYGLFYGRMDQSPSLYLPPASDKNLFLCGSSASQTSSGFVSQGRSSTTEHGDEHHHHPRAFDRKERPTRPVPPPSSSSSHRSSSNKKASNRSSSSVETGIFSDDDDDDRSYDEDKQSTSTTINNSSEKCHCCKHNHRFKNRKYSNKAYDEETSRKQDYYYESDLDSDSRPLKPSSRIIKKGTIKTAGSTTSHYCSDNNSSIAKCIFILCLRLILFLFVMSMFCLFFVGEWPQPLDVYVDSLHDIYISVWNTALFSFNFVRNWYQTSNMSLAMNT